MGAASPARPTLVPATARRIAIIGNAGGGKSTLARRLSESRDLPWREVDCVQFQANWEPAPEAQLLETMEEWVRSDEWVIDGFGPWDCIVERFERADCVVFIDHPLWVHNWLSSVRQRDAALGLGRSGGRPDCDLREVHRRMFETIDRVHRELRPKILAILESLPADRVIRVEGLAALDALLDSERAPSSDREFEVREARPADVPALASLHASFLLDQAAYLPSDRRNPAFDGQDYFRRRLAEEHRATFVAVSEGTLVGFVDGMLFQKGAARGGLRRRLGLKRAEEPLELPVAESYLNNVFVAAEARRAGIANALVNRLAGWMRSHGAVALYTDVSDGNGSSVRMFEACAFVRVRTGMRRDLGT